jgi:hypothetical protein
MSGDNGLTSETKKINVDGLKPMCQTCSILIELPGAGLDCELCHASVHKTCAENDGSEDESEMFVCIKCVNLNELFRKKPETLQYDHCALNGEDEETPKLLMMTAELSLEAKIDHHVANDFEEIFFDVIEEPDEPVRNDLSDESLCVVLVAKIIGFASFDQQTSMKARAKPVPMFHSVTRWTWKLIKRFFALCLLLVSWRNLTTLCEETASELNLNRCGDVGLSKLKNDETPAKSKRPVDAWKKRKIIRSKFEPDGKARFGDIIREERKQNLKQTVGCLAKSDSKGFCRTRSKRGGVCWRAILSLIRENCLNSN